MSCCGGSCKCGNGCGGCKMYPDLEASATVSETIIFGLAPQKGYFEETVFGAVENGCKCGANCTCDSCGCK